MTYTKSAYNIGDMVALSIDSTRQGPILEVLPPIRGEARYRVFHASGDIQTYVESQLDPVVESSHAAAGDAALTPDEFLARLCALRLSADESDAVYSLHAARIKFIPFQFKPVLRFLRADRPRLLIADEVGVGKTIEAGLILRELQSRQELKNVLIVCPKALVTKWRAEMRRFDEDFHALSGHQLRHCLRETDLDGEWPAQYSRAIVHLELLRRTEVLEGRGGAKVRPGLLELASSLHFDLLIVDEAHHLRNPSSLSNQVGRFLCDVSEAVLLLTATPVQIGAENLFHLLHLIRPDLFIDHVQFSEMVAPNRHLNQAIRHLRTKQPSGSWQRDATMALQGVAGTAWGRDVLVRDPRLANWWIRAAQQAPLGDGERVRMLRDLEETHTLAHVMNRTRRRDIGRFTIREPHTIEVDFTPPQRLFYEALLAFRRDVLSLSYSRAVIRLITDTLERQTASCLPALVPTLDSFIKSGTFRPEAITDDLDAEEEHQVPLGIKASAERLRARAAELPDTDPKYDQLAQIVRDTMAANHPRKILVFSFFLHTLEYLANRLRCDGFRVAVVNGKIEDSLREELRARFRLGHANPDAINILLSSEVGCEGLDYEFCDRLVNYDIPWNPMRVEQRIGRIDRFGQRSDKVLIYNFVTPGTVEERIYFRCFKRLGIFADTVGDLEEVLGELTEALDEAALDPTLTPAQAGEKAQQLTDNALRRIEEQRRLEEASKELLELDRALEEEIGRIQEDGRFVSPIDLEQMIGQYLDERCTNATILGNSSQKAVVTLRASQQDRERLLGDLKKLGQQDRTTRDLQRWLEGDVPHLAVTFDQEHALEDRKIPYITPVHPLARMAAAFLATEAELCVRARLADGAAAPGRYVFACHRWERIAFRSETRLVTSAWCLDTDGLDNALARLVPRLLASASRDHAPELVSKPDRERALQALEDRMWERRAKALSDLGTANRQLVDQKLASLDRYYERRLQRADEELNAASETRILNMKRGERERIRREWETKRGEIEAKRNVDILLGRVAYGVIEVVRDGE